MQRYILPAVKKGQGDKKLTVRSHWNSADDEWWCIILALPTTLDFDIYGREKIGESSHLLVERNIGEQ